MNYYCIIKNKDNGRFKEEFKFNYYNLHNSYNIKFKLKVRNNFLGYWFFQNWE